MSQKVHKQYLKIDSEKMYEVKSSGLTATVFVRVQVQIDNLRLLEKKTIFYNYCLYKKFLNFFFLNLNEEHFEL